MSCFEVIPAIDILGGKCVRLTQGKYDCVEKFSNNPEEIAKKWVDLGARRLHIVDLDGAREGITVNYEIIIRIVKTSGGKVQIGGGVRTLEAIKNYIDEGVSYVILGTRAFQDKDFFKEAVALYDQKVILGLDLKDKELALCGWNKTIALDMNELKDYTKGIKQIIYTDISTDGTLSGPNLESIREVANSLSSKIIVSGGFSTLGDITKIIDLREDECTNISGVILGKSLYKGTIDLVSAIELANKVE